ncbi:unnamed protein product [Calypogeia fissa]
MEQRQVEDEIDEEQRLVLIESEFCVLVTSLCVCDQREEQQEEQKQRAVGEGEGGERKEGRVDNRSSSSSTVAVV